MPKIAATIALAALSGCVAPAAGSVAARPVHDAVAPVPRSASLRIAKSVAPNPMIIGGESVYAVTVTNTGDQDAENVRITDVLDPDVTLVRIPAGCSSAGRSIACGGPGLTIGPGDSVTYRIPVTTDPALPDGTNVRTRAQVSASGVPEDATQLVSQTRTLTDAEITKTAPASVNPDGTITYILTVTNHGPSQAVDVTVQDETDGNRTTIIDRPAECPGGGLTLTCPLGTLAPAESRTFAFTVAPDVTGVIENCAAVYTGSREENTANNRSCAETAVEPVKPAQSPSPTPSPPTPTPTPSPTLTVTPTAPGTPAATPAESPVAAGPDESPEPGPQEGGTVEDAGPPPPRPEAGDEVAAPREDRDTLPMTGVSVWMLWLGVAVLLAVGLLVRYFSRREPTDGTP
ncbi:hypothetical protein GCM10022419_009840 [Nonomuraea rosea]|uniref:DUF11 domain-containing protein n=2 Tax=Nonomuraea rosea TaxID=638574 RepID=A0ABP6VEU1_9ACTN